MKGHKMGSDRSACGLDVEDYCFTRPRTTAIVFQSALCCYSSPLRPSIDLVLSNITTNSSRINNVDTANTPLSVLNLK